MKNPRELIIPVFVPHAGCTHSCVFCNQNNITGCDVPPGPDEVHRLLSARLGPDTGHAVIAFYGGSFTCLPRGEQAAYLETAGYFIERGHADYVRVSTRPDCVDAETAEYLHRAGVRVVELGAQSMDDGVLAASARGHKAADTLEAAGVIKDAGLRLGIQIMAGLPGDSAWGFMDTVREVAGLSPEFVRIYPVLVVKGSPLERIYGKGDYAPMGLDEAVSVCADAHEVLRASGIKVVRTGLQPSEALEASLVAGPYHPAFGHLVGSELALRRMLALMEAEKGRVHAGDVEFAVNPAELSEYLGIRKSNLERLRRHLGPRTAITPDEGVPPGDLSLRRA